MSDGMFDSLSDAGMRPPKAMTPPNSAMEAAREIVCKNTPSGIHPGSLAYDDYVAVVAEKISRHQSQERAKVARLVAALITAQACPCRRTCDLCKDKIDSAIAEWRDEKFESQEREELLGQCSALRDGLLRLYGICKFVDEDGVLPNLLAQWKLRIAEAESLLSRYPKG